MTNSTVFEKLKPNQELYFVRYSHSPYPDFIEVYFNGFNKGSIEIKYNDKMKLVKKSKAEHRLFLDKNEMARSLYYCFEQRKISLAIEYKEIVNRSQEERPELWI